MMMWYTSVLLLAASAHGYVSSSEGLQLTESQEVSAVRKSNVHMITHGAPAAGLAISLNTAYTVDATQGAQGRFSVGIKIDNVDMNIGQAMIDVGSSTLAFCNASIPAGASSLPDSWKLNGIQQCVGYGGGGGWQGLDYQSNVSLSSVSGSASFTMANVACMYMRLDLCEPRANLPFSCIRCDSLFCRCGVHSLAQTQCNRRVSAPARPVSTPSWALPSRP